MTEDEAIEAVSPLKTLPFCPDSEGLRAVARDLVIWCQGFQGWQPHQQALWVVQQIRNTWDRWHGSKLMREIFDQKFTVHPPDPVDEWRKQGLKPDPEFSLSLISQINGKATPQQIDELRWEGIRSALEYQRRPQRETDKPGRKFWGEFLFAMENDHPAEVTEIRAGRTPQHPAPDAYKLNWADMPRNAKPHEPGNQRGARL